MNVLRVSAVKTGMKRPAVALAATLLLAGVWTSAASDETERVSRTISLEPGGTVRLKSFSGRVTITGSDRRDVAVDAVRRADRDRLDRIKLDIHKDGDTVVIDANHRESWSFWTSHNNVVETDFDIKVPRRTNLDLNVFSAPVTVVGVEGSHNVHTFSARVRLEDVAGPIQTKTFSGPVEVRATAWVDNQSVDIDTFSGDINLRLPDTARGTVTFNSFSGRFSSELPLVFRSSNRRSVKAELGSGDGGRLQFKTFSGSVHIDR